MNKNRKKLCPFRGWALENFPFIENDFDALTNYAMISKMTNYINNMANDLFTVETNLNEVVDVVNDLELDIDELAGLINSVNINLSNLTTKVNTVEINLSTLTTKVDTLESEIPTKTSQLINDSDFTTKSYVDGIVGDINAALDLINGEVV